MSCLYERSVSFLVYTIEKPKNQVISVNIKILFLCVLGGEKYLLITSEPANQRAQKGIIIFPIFTYGLYSCRMIFSLERSLEILRKVVASWSEN